MTALNYKNTNTDATENNLFEVLDMALENAFYSLIIFLDDVNNDWLREHRYDFILAGFMYFIAYPNVVDSRLPETAVSILTAGIIAAVFTALLSYFISSVAFLFLESSDQD